MLNSSKPDIFGNFFEDILLIFVDSTISALSELKTKFILKNENHPLDFNNRAIWGKLITKRLLNKMILDVGTKYTDDYINYAEDTIMVFSLFHLANSYYLMKELGYFYSLGLKIKEFPKLKNKVCKPNNKII